MMLSVLVWLAMWGQAQTTPAPLDDPGIVRPFEQYESHWATPPPAPKPAEHVIEIKTRRTNHRLCRANDLYDDYGCFVKTRELWIDNVKFGIIKGLD